jgi:hypothetical protein
MRLDPESKQYVAINIHRGLTRHESCSFGKASSHAIFQCTMKICIATDELNFSDFCILPNQENSLLNFGNFRKAKNVFPHCPIFFSIFYYIILHISCFSVYFSHFFPNYFQHLPDIRSKFALQLIDISICTSLEILVRLYRNMVQSISMIF